MTCAHSVNMVQTGFVQVPRQLHRRLHVHVVPQEAPALVLTADFILHSVGCVDTGMVLQRPTVT